MGLDLLAGAFLAVDESGASSSVGARRAVPALPQRISQGVTGGCQGTWSPL